MARVPSPGSCPRFLLNDSNKCRRVAMEIMMDREPVIQTETPYRGGIPMDALGLRAPVEYAQPSYADLKKAFDWVYAGYKNTEFKPIDVCKDVSKESREIEFELVHINKDVSTDTALAELERRELRPALYEGLLAFAAKYPELQKQFPIVALGSVCRFGGDLYSPYVDGGRRCAGPELQLDPPRLARCLPFPRCAQTTVALGTWSLNTYPNPYSLGP